MTVKQRAAAPAFQFYPSDWMSGAPAHMVPDETHVYIWLLCLDWESTGFEFNQKDLAHWCRLPRRRFAKAWERVSRSFVERDGRYYNPRLERERRKQEIWREKSAEGGRRGAGKRWPQRQGGIQGGVTTVNRVANRVVTPPHTPNEHQTNTLQTSVRELRSNSNPPKTSGKAGALVGARTREQDELDDINRRRIARGEAPVDAL